MLGAIYGDKAGSIHEYGQIKEIKPVAVDDLITKESFYSDDTIETIAVIDAIINKKDYEETLREYILKYESYRPRFKPYFETSFSKGTIAWAHKKGRNDSIGNGALMRISPVGYLFDTEKEVKENANLVTKTSHNSEDAITSSIIIALMIYYFRQNMPRDEVYKKLGILLEYYPFKKFNTTCKETLSNCLYQLYYSTSFEDALKRTLIMGGDTDTNCAIVGSVAEAMYGMTEEEKRLAKQDLPKEFVKILDSSYR